MPQGRFSKAEEGAKLRGTTVTTSDQPPLRRDPPAADMTVGALMRPCEEIVHPDHPLREAATRLLMENETLLPVCDGDELVGIVSANQLRSSKLSSDSGYLTVRDAMADEFSFCYEDDSIEVAREIVKRNRVDKICVVNAHKKLVGLLTLDDLVRHIRLEPKDEGAEADGQQTRGPNIRERRIHTAGAAKQPSTDGPPAYSSRPKIRK